MKAAVPACVAAIDACRAQVVGLNQGLMDLLGRGVLLVTCPINQALLNITACVVAVDTCNIALLEPYQLSGRNVYDMRIPCEVKPLCYDFSNVATYLKRADVQAAL
eukprot:gene16631-20074_t